jgi:hypothetical protein
VPPRSAPVKRAVLHQHHHPLAKSEPHGQQPAHDLAHRTEPVAQRRAVIADRDQDARRVQSERHVRIVSHESAESEARQHQRW